MKKAVIAAAFETEGEDGILKNKKIFNKKEIAALNEFKNTLNTKAGSEVKSVTLFGSKARGDCKRGSDIDMLAIVRNRKKADLAIYAIIAEILEKYYVDLSVVTYTEGEFKNCYRKGSLFLREIEREGKALWTRN
ncbi:MAG: nucleotidyltransferase domain-containing protein [Candidatus Omnitrophica bacterium]|nr:nucleotidyltransferase domain-containing protein [Candidatus Omnitrophota bacterium]